LTVIPIEARDAGEIDDAFAKAVKARAAGMIVQDSAVFVRQRLQIANLAKRYRIATVSPFAADVEAGALACYGHDLMVFYRNAAHYVDRILKGAKPGEIPVEQPMRFELVINLATANAIGIRIPQSVLLQANRVID